MLIQHSVKSGKDEIATLLRLIARLSGNQLFHVEAAAEAAEVEVAEVAQDTVVMEYSNQEKNVMCLARSGVDNRESETISILL
jgi:ABC-type nitrate/sulfonate/bicarbonate transport system ATPase subunit